MISRRAGTNKAPAGLLLAVAVCAALAGRAAPAAGAADVTAEQVSAAIHKAVGSLRDALKGGGAGRFRRVRNWHTEGQRALVALAMLNAGVPADDPDVAAALERVQAMPDERTYVVALKCQVLAAADPKTYARQLAAAARWLAAAQLRNGMWTYTHAGPRRRGLGDNSNTQFGLLGLHEAAKAGVRVPRQVWERSRRHFENTQAPDGGWAYRHYAGRHRASLSYGSMSAAGVASLYICGQRLHVGGPKRFINGAYPSCGKYRQNKAIAAGLGWLTKHFSVTTNPRPGRPGGRGGWLHYYLYALERVGMISGLRNLGAHDWYREGAAHLVASQRADGTWGSARDTTFALLFLAKGNRPVLFQKLKWSHPTRPNEWNRNIHDLENLTAFIGEKFGKPVTWQTISLAAPVADLRTSPVLFVTGHEFPRFTAAERRKLRSFVDAGGTLLFEACCGSPAFAEGFREFADTLYAEVGLEYKLRKLRADHPVFSAYYRLDDTYDMEGIDIGCKTGVFFSPHALSCLWEMEDYTDKRTAKPWSQMAMKLGTNVAAYATGREQLPDKLTRVEVPESARPASQPAEVPRGAVRIARLVHRGDYNADPHAMVNLAAMLRDQAKVDVVARARHLRATDEALWEYPVLFMTGHHAFELSDEEIKALRVYLNRGGFLFADACCGREAFDKSFRAMAARLFGEDKLRALPRGHPIYAGRVGVRLGELRYRRILAEELKAAGRDNWRGTTRPPLEGVRLDGRTVLVYSKYDYSCALEGDKPYSCRGYVDAAGRRLALNIVLYAITY
jgi:hypothetical protein